LADLRLSEQLCEIAKLLLKERNHDTDFNLDGTLKAKHIHIHIKQNYLDGTHFSHHDISIHHSVGFPNAEIIL
jgi:hypothetical protein